MKNTMKLMGSLFIFCTAIIASAEIKTPKIFSDNMILQRSAPVKIWGTANPSATVDVEFLGQKKSTSADANGKWNVVLDAMPAEKNPQTMKIYENKNLSKSISNILVGEVWILGGQSNMEWVVQNTTDYENAKQRAQYPTFRYFTQPSEAIAETEQFDSPQQAKWLECNDQTVGRFSAVGFYCGEKIMKELDVPVALVNTSFGGTTMRTWVPDSAIDSIPFWKKSRESFLKEKAKYNYEASMKKWQDTLDQYNQNAKKLKAEGKIVPPKNDYLKYNKPHKITPLNSRVTPSYLYNAKIAPIAGFSARGILWYQGESDSWGETLDTFALQYSTLISAWRKAWNNDKMYAVAMQMPSYKPESWPRLRMQQAEGAKMLKRSEIVNIIDTGEEKDVHPREKNTAGERAANVILNKVYKKDIVAFGPSPKSVDYTSDGVVIKMDLHKAKKLTSKGDLRGFEVKIDGKWEDAIASISGKSILISASDKSLNSKIEGVRYLWRGYALPFSSLYSDSNLPAPSFLVEK